MSLLRGLEGRFHKTLYGAVTLIVLVTATCIPALASHHHSFHSTFHYSHIHSGRVETQAQHNARVALAGARQAKLAGQNQALHSGSVVKAASAFRGTRYVFGGTSRSGFDCSGFVRYIIGQSAGVSLPRTAMEQFYNGTKIDPSNMKPGDLVFFKGTYRSGISHVGIYIGNGQFIHASNEARGVTTDDLNTPYYQKHFAGARRVIEDRESGEE